MKSGFITMLVISVLFLSSCEKGVEFELDDVAAKLVVEATIENGQAPVVSLSRSQAFFSQIDFTVLANSFVRNAEVYVSNGIVTHKLKEYTVPVVPGINFYYYSNDPASPATAVFGELKKQYTLRIIAEGKEYTAITTIPDTTKRVDSLFSRPAPAGNPPGKVAVMARIFDPPGFGDYIRYFTRRNREPFYPGYSVFDDKVIDGSSYEVLVERGVDRNNGQDDDSFFEKGDTVTVKLCNIDKATYDFWRTMEYTYSSVGNPFSSPTKVVNNIKGGGLGYFGGYAVQYHTIIIPR
ncbi:MAG: DUF4249 domain-containing protein [Ferruginibacter sp.]|nr:DUF4249 domain-containing protein [Chitinophagaceae bacterium]